MLNIFYTLVDFAVKYFFNIKIHYVG